MHYGPRGGSIGLTYFSFNRASVYMFVVSFVSDFPGFHILKLFRDKKCLDLKNIQN
jgi:hypothetical protein